MTTSVGKNSLPIIREERDDIDPGNPERLNSKPSKIYKSSVSGSSQTMQNTRHKSRLDYIGM
jgi:hypothetical protein